jgi:hypothetical protein
VGYLPQHAPRHHRRRGACWRRGHRRGTGLVWCPWSRRRLRRDRLRGRWRWRRLRGHVINNHVRRLRARPAEQRPRPAAAPPLGRLAVRTLRLYQRRPSRTLAAVTRATAAASGRRRRRRHRILGGRLVSRASRRGLLFARARGVGRRTARARRPGRIVGAPLQARLTNCRFGARLWSHAAQGGGTPVVECQALASCSAHRKSTWLRCVCILVFGTTLPENIGVLHASSQNMVPKAPNAYRAGGESPRARAARRGRRARTSARSHRHGRPCLKTVDLNARPPRRRVSHSAGARTALGAHSAV